MSTRLLKYDICTRILVKFNVSLSLGFLNEETVIRQTSVQKIGTKNNRIISAA